MRKIYVVLMHTDTIPSKLVKLFTRYKYSHVAISLDKSCYTTYSFGRKDLKNILNGGFSIQNKDGEFFKKFNGAICKIYEVEVQDSQYEMVQKMLTDMENNKDIYKYDFLGIILRFFKLPITFKNKFVCSYFVAYILERANICAFEQEACLVVPKNFEDLDGFNEIYMGSYMKYSCN